MISMTEEELSVRLNELYPQAITPCHSRQTSRAYRRDIAVRKNAHLYRIVTTSVVPHVGCVESEGYFDGSRYRIEYTGRYVKRAGRNGCQRWIKRETSGRMRRYRGNVSKGNFYRRLFDYWNTLY